MCKARFPMSVCAQPGLGYSVQVQLHSPPARLTPHASPRYPHPAADKLRLRGFQGLGPQAAASLLASLVTLQGAEPELLRWVWLEEGIWLEGGRQ